MAHPSTNIDIHYDNDNIEREREITNRDVMREGLTSWDNYYCYDFSLEATTRGAGLNMEKRREGERKKKEGRETKTRTLRMIERIDRAEVR